MARSLRRLAMSCCGSGITQIVRQTTDVQLSFNPQTNILTLTQGTATPTRIDLSSLAGAIAPVAGAVSLDIAGNNMNLRVDGNVVSTADLTRFAPGEWLITTNRQQLEWGRRYIFFPTFDYFFPKVTQIGGNQWIRATPSGGDWSGFSGNWAGAGTDTVGQGQAGTLATGSGEILFLGQLGNPSNIFINV